MRLITILIAMTLNATLCLAGPGDGFQIEAFAKDFLMSPENIVMEAPTMDSDGVTISFQSLSEESFNLLKLGFQQPGHPHRVLSTYKEDQPYHLTDFLPPIMNAMHGQNLYRLKVKAPWLDEIIGRTLQLFSETDCTSTLYDILTGEAQSGFHLVIPPSKLMYDFLHSPENASSVEKQNLKPYDYVVFDDKANKDQVVHVAVSLGYGLIFQKTGNVSMDNYEVSTVASTTKFYNILVASGMITQLNVLYFRPNRKWPDFKDKWSAQALESLFLDDPIYQKTEAAEKRNLFIHPDVEMDNPDFRYFYISRLRLQPGIGAEANAYTFHPDDKAWIEENIPSLDDDHYVDPFPDFKSN